MQIRKRNFGQIVCSKSQKIFHFKGKCPKSSSPALQLNYLRDIGIVFAR